MSPTPEPPQSQDYSFLVLAYLMSIIGTIMISIHYWKAEKRFFNTLIIFLTIIQLLDNIIEIILIVIILFSEKYSVQDSQSLCNFSGFIQSFSMQSSLIIQILIVFSLQKMNFDKSKKISSWKTIKKFQIPIIVIPIIFAIIPLFVDSYSPYQPYQEVNCGLDNSKISGKILSLFVCILPFWGGMIFQLIVIFNISKRKEKNREKYNERKKYIYIMMYPVIQYLCWIIPVIKNTLHTLGDNLELSWSYYYIYPFTALQGFINCLFYGLSNINQDEDLYEKLDEYNNLQASNNNYSMYHLKA